MQPMRSPPAAAPALSFMLCTARSMSPASSASSNSCRQRPLPPTAASSMSARVARGANDAQFDFDGGVQRLQVALDNVGLGQRQGLPRVPSTSFMAAALSSASPAVGVSGRNSRRTRSTAWKPWPFSAAARKRALGSCRIFAGHAARGLFDFPRAGADRPGRRPPAASTSRCISASRMLSRRQCSSPMTGSTLQRSVSLRNRCTWSSTIARHCSASRCRSSTLRDTAPCRSSMSYRNTFGNRAISGCSARGTDRSSIEHGMIAPGFHGLAHALEIHQMGFSVDGGHQDVGLAAR